MALSARYSTAVLFVACAAMTGCIVPTPKPVLVDKPNNDKVAPTIVPVAYEENFASDQKATTAKPFPPAAQITPPSLEGTPQPKADQLTELIQAVFQNNPRLKQAAADVAAAHGAAIQAGLHPNPTVGYQGDQIGSGNTAGQQGAFLNQTIVTRGKLALAQAAALAEVARTEAAVQKVQADLAADIRADLFAIRTASEGVKIAEEMASRAEAVYIRQKKLLESGQAVAPHEVSQAEALAITARGEVIQARNRRTAALKKLAATVASTELSNIEVEPIESPLPGCSFDALKQHVLTAHSDLRAAAAQIERARFQLELARAMPYPNVETQTYVQHDYQTRTPQVGVQIGVALPVFDRNQGAIAEAEANLIRATHEADRVRIELTRQLAEAYGRYSTNQKLAEQYLTEILPAQRKATEGVGKRFEQEPGKVSFSEVVLAQQTLANTYSNYIATLSAAWQAAAELTRLTQSNDWCPSAGASSTPDSWPDPAKK